MVSGQAANPDTQGDCTVGFRDVFPGPMPDGQVLGVGCVYPAAVKTVADQLDAAGLSWKGYMQDMGTPCRHPAIGALDDTQKARVGDQYAVRHNPFMYFHSIIDGKARCDAHVVPLDALAQDLKSSSTTPSYSFITPNLCEDGHDAPCVDGRPGGLVSADAFLKTWIPRILASPAYADGGLVVVTWDEGNIGPETSGACCGEQSGPNTPAPGILGPGGGRTGTVVLSPFVRPGSVNDTPYNHYALLRSVEDLFGLGHLGYAGAAGLKAFGDDVFNGSGPASGRDSNDARCTTRVRRSGRTLSVRSARAGSLAVTVRGKRLRSARRVAACRTVRVALPRRGHGTAIVRVAGKRYRVRY